MIQPSETPQGVSDGRMGRPFQLLWIGQAVSQFGDYLPYVSLPLFVAFLTDGTVDLAVVYSLEIVPTIIVGIFGGVLIDRLRLRYTMIAADLIRAIAFMWLAVLSVDVTESSGGSVLAVVFTVAFIAGTFSTFFNGALHAAVPRLVPSERLADANGRLAATQGLANVVGPGLAGVLVATAGYWPTFLINSATFLVSATTLAFVRGLGDRGIDQAGGAIEPIRILDGLRHLWAQPLIRMSTLAIAGAHLVLGFFEATLVLIANQIGATTDAEKGIIYAVFGAGALVGSVVVPRFTRMVGLGRALVVGIFVTGVLMFAFVNLPFGVVGLAALFTAMIGFQAMNISFLTIRQVFTPPEMQGRLAAAARAAAWSTLPLGALGGAALSTGVGFNAVYPSAPLFLVVVGLAMLPTVLWKDRTLVEPTGPA